MAQAPGMLGTVAWTKVDVLTSYQRLSAEMQIHARLPSMLNEPENTFRMRNVSAEPLLPGAVSLNGVPEGTFNKVYVCGIRTVEPEPPPPDQVMEVIRRYAMFQGATFMVSGFAEFPKAAAHEMHTEMLLKGRFFQLVDATVTMIGVAGKAWTQPNIYINRDQMLSLFLG
jgi:hypothetical protein